MTGRVAKTVDVEPRGRLITTRFTYGPFNVVDTITDPLNHQTSYEYDANGRQMKRTNPTPAWTRGRTTPSTM